MKKCAFLKFALITYLSVFTVATSSRAMSPTNNLPVQISDYYSNYNFVSLFSSEIERDLITDSLMCQGVLSDTGNFHLDQSNNFCDEIPKLPLSERISRISQLITGLNKHVIRDTRDKMAIQPYMPGASSYMRSSHPQVMPLFPNPYSVPPLFFKVNQVKLNGDSATVEVTSYQIDRETNAKLVSQYQKYGSAQQGNVANEELLKTAVPSAILKREYHQWVLNDGRWQKFENSAALIER